MKNAAVSTLPAPSLPQTDLTRVYLTRLTDDLLASLPPAEQLSAEERRGIIARYSSVLEGNFIYWMTGAYLAARSEEAREIIVDNLNEEVRDSHPHMLRKFEIGAHAEPTEADARVVYPNLTEMRLFIGRMSPVPILATMAFFESFIQRFMAYLEELAVLQGSNELEYTQVHGVCDIAHSEGLFRGLEAEIALEPDSQESSDRLLEGVHLLRALIVSMFTNKAAVAA